MNRDIESRPGVGLRVCLDNYNVIRSAPGGNHLWEPSVQLFLLNSGDAALGALLPTVTSDGLHHVMFKLVDETGHEVTSRTTRADLSRLPPDALDDLRARVAAFRRWRADPNVAPDKRATAETFVLPNPKADPDFYRTYTVGGEKRLCVLWGCERKDAVVAPSLTIAQFEQSLSTRRKGGWSPLIWLLLIPAIVALMLLLTCLLFPSLGICPSNGPSSDSVVKEAPPADQMCPDGTIRLRDNTCCPSQQVRDGICQPLPQPPPSVCPDGAILLRDNTCCPSQRVRDGICPPPLPHPPAVCPRGSLRLQDGTCAPEPKPDYKLTIEEVTNMGKGKARVRYKLSLNESNENLANARWELLKISQTGSLNTAQTEKGSSADFELSENQNYVLRITPKTGASPMEYDARTASNIITTLTPRAGSYRK